jgi:hypothetical protein
VPSIGSNPRSLAAPLGLLFVVGLLLVAGVQLSDPGVTPVGPEPDPDAAFDGQTADLASAMRASERTSRVQMTSHERWNGTTGSWETVGAAHARLAFDPADRELLSSNFERSPPGPDVAWHAYTTADGQYVRHDGWSRRDRLVTYGDVDGFRVAALADATVERERRANGTLYAVDGAEGLVTSVGGPLPHGVRETNVTVRVGEAGFVREVRVVRPAAEGGERGRVRITYGGYGETAVERPDGVPRRSSEGLLWDLVYGPLYDPSDG